MKRFLSASSALLVAAMVVMFVGCGENTNSETEYSGTAIAMTANGEVVYDIDFGTPPHTVGDLPATGDPTDPTPRNKVTQVRFGNPIVVSAFESLTDQPLLFDDTEVCEECCFDLANGKCGDQIWMDVPGELQGEPTYCTQAEVLISETLGTDRRFVILQDTPRVRNIEFRAGTISAANPDDPGNESVQIGTYTRGQVIQVQSELDFASGLDGTWTVWLNGSEVFSGPIIIVTGDSDGLAKVRFSTDVATDIPGTVAAADNIEISAGPCEPVNAPPVISVDQDPVTVDEGELALNTGTVSDEDGDTVTLTASLGDVTNEGDGTWSWSYTPPDGPSAWTVTITADDGNGGTADVTFELLVRNVAPVVGPIFVPTDPVNINDQPLVASADFYDPAGADDEPYVCTVNYGDGAGPQIGTAVGTTCTGPDQTYGAAGVYLVTVEVTDKDGGIGSATATEFIVIYDPSGGFVTGGGWIDSPEGAYVPQPELVGKASFGFVSKYKKGAMVPTGNTEFQFKVADLNFKSTSYDWLVIAGDNARYKGIGTINGEGDYKFMLWGGDGTPDTFRIRIWTEDEATAVETDVYDNGFGQELGGGSVAIHKGK